MTNHKTKTIASILCVSITLLAWLGLVPVVSPVAQAQSSTLYTTFIAQNLDPTNLMHTKLTYYNQNGQVALATTNYIEPYRTLSIDQRTQPGLPTNFVGAAVFDSDKPFGLIVTEYAGNASTLGSNFK